MEIAIVCSGFGGQGVLFAGQILTYAAADLGKYVTWIPSYGPEMRGGTAHCTVVISDEAIGSPLVRNPDVVLAMNLPSVDKYEPLLKPGGLLVVNASLVTRPIDRSDIDVVLVPANEIAGAQGDVRLANVVMLGALLATTDLLPLEAAAQALTDHLPARHRDLLADNLAALHAGVAYAPAPVPV